MEYEALEPIDRDEAEAALARGASDELARVVLAVGMYEPDFGWAQELCLALAAHDEPAVRGSALRAIGHLARVHGKVSLDRALDALRAGLADEDAYVRGRAEAAADDVERFLDLRVR